MPLRAAALALAILLLGGLASSAMAQANANPPTKLTYQGFLTDQNGVPVGNTAPVNKTIIFRLYDALTAGTKLWASQQTVTVDKGHFSVLLGEGSAVGSEPFSTDLTSNFIGATASERYLELTVDNATIAPRLQFLTSPYAFLARRANEVDGAALISGSIPSARLSGVDGSGLVSINANNISAGTVNDARLSANVAKLNTAQTFTAINTFSDSIRINGNKVVNFGYDVAGRESSAGQIGYGTHSAGGSLDIVGAGASASARKIQMWAEGGMQVNGTLTASGFAGNGIIPVGGIIMWSGAPTAIPGGWALCDGGNGTPDLRSRFIVGASAATGPSGLTKYNKGDTGGEERHTLTIAEMPSHNHSWGHGVERDDSGSGGSYNEYTQVGGSDTGVIGYTGGNQAHETRPPYYALAFIMRTQ